MKDTIAVDLGGRHVAAILLPLFFSLSLSAQSRNVAITGQVIDGTTGKPVAGVLVQLSVPPELLPRNTRPPLPVMTNESGNFSFTGPGPGSYRITATRAGYVQGEYGKLRPEGLGTGLHIVESQPAANLKIRVWKYAAIAGTITDEAGEPLVGVRVRALRSGYMAGRRRFVGEATASTDDRGMYRMGKLVPGNYVVVVPSVQTTLPADIAAEAESASPSMPVAIAVRTLRQIGSSGVYSNTAPTQVGNFALQRSAQALTVPASSTQDPGRLAVYPTTYNGDTTIARQAPAITLGSGEARLAVDLHLRVMPAWRVSGRLLGPEGTTPLQALKLFPTTSGDELGETAGTEIAVALTDRTGAFTFLGVPPGQYVLRGNSFADVRLPNAPPGRQGGPNTGAAATWWLTEPVVVSNQDVTINPTWREAFSLSGRVVLDGVGAPAPAALTRIPILVESVTQTQIPGLGRPATIAPDNTFSTVAIPAGRYLVRVGSSPPGWTLRSVMYEGHDISDVGFDMKGPASDLVMTFTDRLTSLSGSVSTTPGGVAEDATVLLFPVDPAGWQDFGLNPRRFKSTRVEANGSFAFPDVAPGDYFAIAIPEEQCDRWRDPDRLDALSRQATRVHLDEGSRLTQPLRAVSVR